MKSNHDPLNLIICGIGGQGNILLSRMIGRILTTKGYKVTIGETFGAAQRGGSVYSGLRVSKNRFYGPLIPEGQAHVLLALEPLEGLRILNVFGNPDVVTVANTQAIYPVGVLSQRDRYPEVEALKSAIQEFSSSSWFLNATETAIELKAPIVANIVMLGALAGSQAIPFDTKDVEDEIKNSFPESKVDLNLRAMQIGVSAIQ